MIAAVTLFNAPAAFLPGTLPPTPHTTGASRAMSVRMVTGEAHAIASTSTSHIHDRLMELSAAMRERELARDAASVVSEMQVIDVVHEANRVAMAKAAAAVTNEMELIDAQNGLRKATLATEAAVIASEMQGARNAVLIRQNEHLQAKLRVLAPGRITEGSYYGKPCSHSLKLCIAHARDAAIAARLDLLWQVQRVRYRFQLARRAISFRAMVLKVRYGLRAARMLSELKNKIAEAMPGAPATAAAAA